MPHTLQISIDDIFRYENDLNCTARPTGEDYVESTAATSTEVDADETEIEDVTEANVGMGSVQKQLARDSGAEVHWSPCCVTTHD